MTKTNSQNIQNVLQHLSQKKVGDIGIILKGKGILKSEVTESGLPCVRYGELYTKYNFHFKVTHSYCSEETATQSQKILKGDILFAGSGETAIEIGKCAAYMGKEVAFAGGDIIILRPEKDDSIFLSYLFNSDEIVKQKAILGQGNAVVHIYPKDIASLIIQLPSLDEQKKIAKILTTWDEAIETLENLIQKKERHKKVLMQQLLTGKKRFKEFNGEKWKKVLISEYCKTYSGGTPLRSNKNYYGGNIPWLKSGELNNEKIYSTEETITKEGLENSSAKLVDVGTILLALYGATAGVVAQTFIKTSLNQAILAIIPNEKLKNEYLYYYLKMIMPLELNRLLQGGQPNLSADMVKNITINVPPPKEQDKIVSMLSGADEEIQTLKTQLEHSKQQKKGLMQVLLTGKIRVKV